MFYRNREGEEISISEYSMMLSDNRYCFVAGTLISAPDGQHLYAVSTIFNGRGYETAVTHGDEWEVAWRSCHEDGALFGHKSVAADIMGTLNLFRITEYSANDLPECAVPYRSGMTLEKAIAEFRAIDVGTPAVIEAPWARL